MIIASIFKESRHLILKHGSRNNALDKNLLVVTCAYKDSNPLLSNVILVVP